MKNVAKPVAKKALESGISHVGDEIGKKVGKKVVEKSGDLIMKRLASRFNPETIVRKSPKNEESFDILINRSISSS